MTEPQGSSEQNHHSSHMPQQGVFENVQAGGDISFRDLLQILLVPGRGGQESERQGIRHNLPQPDYGQFIGREHELTKIFQKLRPYPHSTNSVITIDGIGGIGKSALALEVAHRFLRDYSKLPVEERFEAIIWSSAKRTILRPDRGIVTRQQACQTLEDICKSIAFTLTIEEQIRARQSEIVEFVCRALTQQRTLLIIDNLETIDDEAVIEFLQESLPAPTKAIVTTRHRLDVAYPIRLSGMPWKDAEQLIEQECQKKNVVLSTEEITRLYNRTGGVPLAIVWTVARIGFGRRTDTVLASLGSPQGDVAHFCFKEVINYIKDRDAYNLLLALAVCKGEATREELRYVAGFEEDELSCDEGLVELDVLSLISKRGNTFIMLPLTKEYVAHQLKSDPDFERKALERLNNYKIKPLILQARAKACNILQKYYGQTRLLNARLANIDSLYVDVDVLIQPSSQIYAESSEALQASKLNQQCDNLGLELKQSRCAGTEIISQYEKLMILGKPGAGKSTFLRYLATNCCKENHFPDYVPILLELKTLGNEEDCDLLKLIHKEFGFGTINDTQQILDSGKAFILLDALDELSPPLRRKTQNNISKFCKRYYKNRIIITCRNQSDDYKLPMFNYVELADFNVNQVKQFANNWFSTFVEESEQAVEINKRFVRALEQPECNRIVELSTSPMLLSLICWIFQNSGTLPRERLEISRHAVDLLLSKWDEQKGVQRDSIYQNLTLEGKKRLLGYIATRKREQTQGVFFDQDELVNYIRDYFIKDYLDNISLEDCRGILRGIESQNGLIVERAKGLYSFSNRTFQEYFLDWFEDES